MPPCFSLPFERKQRDVKGNLILILNPMNKLLTAIAQLYFWVPLLLAQKKLPWRRPMILGGFPTGIALASCIQPLIASEASPTLASRQQIETSLCLTHKLR